MNEPTSIAELADLGLILLIVFAILSALGVYAVCQMQARRPSATSFPDRPSLHFQGRGERTVTANGLIESAYRIDYRLPSDTLVKIELIERATGNDALILIKSGEGIDGFNVSRAGDYLLRIEPLAEDAIWSFEIRPVGPKLAE